MLLTCVNFGFISFLWNFVCNLAKLDLRHFVIAAFDAPTYAWCTARGLPVFFFPVPGANITSDPVAFHNPDYVALTKAKPLVTAALLARGYGVFFFDVDVVVFHNPFHVPRRRDVLYISSDRHFTPPHPLTPPIAVDPYQVRNVNPKGTVVNSGVYYAPATPAVRAAFDRINALLAGPFGDGDQPAFADVLCPPPARRAGDRRCLFAPGAAVAERYPTARFPLEVHVWPLLVAANGATRLSEREDLW